MALLVFACNHGLTSYGVDRLLAGANTFQRMTVFLSFFAIFASIEADEDGFFVGDICPAMPSVHLQHTTLAFSLGIMRFGRIVALVP